MPTCSVSSGSTSVHDGFETFIHATDLAEGFAATVEASRPGCEIYNMGARTSCPDAAGEASGQVSSPRPTLAGGLAGPQKPAGD